MAVWKYRLNVAGIFHATEQSFEQRRDAVVHNIQSSRFYDKARDQELEDIVEGLSFAEDFEEFDRAWSDFYDWADQARVWVQTW